MKSNDSHLMPDHLIRQTQSTAPLSVSQLNRAAKQLLESEFLQVYVEGEISNFSRPSSGHWYFSLKDDLAQIRCAFFKGRNVYCRQNVANGSKVAVRGKISLYEARGEYQFIVEQLEEAGIGDLQTRFEALKKQLHQEGLFEPARKQPLPEHPKKIAVITSPTGAAIQDMLSVFARRYAQLQIDIIPVMVQGDQAGPQIVAALQWVSELGIHDAVVVARGGGSIEDLWAFNEERVARAIADCPLPVVSAVGHETDFTIADFVADSRAPTPSAAAEILSPDSRQHAAKLQQLERRLSFAIKRCMSNKTSQLNLTRRNLRHPAAQIQQWNQRLDELESRLNNSQSRLLNTYQKDINSLTSRLRIMSPMRQLQTTQASLDRAQQNLKASFSQIIMHYRARVEEQNKQATSHIVSRIKQDKLRLIYSSQLLHNLSPLNVLGRGYALTRSETKQLVKSVQDTGIGQKIHVQLHDGSLQATVEAIDTSQNK